MCAQPFGLEATISLKRLRQIILPGEKLFYIGVFVSPHAPPQNLRGSLRGSRPIWRVSPGQCIKCRASPNRAGVQASCNLRQSRNLGQRIQTITAIRARRMRQGQHPAGHTIHLSDNGRQVSARHPCCQKESAAACQLPGLAERALMHRRRQRSFAFGISSRALSIWAQLLPPAGRRFCDRSCGAS